MRLNRLRHAAFLAFSLISSGSFAQHIELVAEKDFAGTVRLASNGVYLCNGLNLRYTKSITEKEAASKLEKDHPYRKVKWDVKNTSFNPIGYTVKNDTLHCLGYVTDSETRKKTVMHYAFDEQLNMVQEEVVVVASGGQNALYSALTNADGTRTALLCYEYELTDRKSKTYTQAAHYYHFNEELAPTASGTFSMAAATIDEVAMSKRSREFYRSAQLLNNGTITLNFGGKLYVGYYNEHELFPVDLEVEKEIKSYRLYDRLGGEVTLIGGYQDGKECGISVIDFNKDMSVKTQDYYTVSEDFTKSYYTLAYDQNNVPAGQRKETERMGSVHPVLLDSHIEEDGTIRLAFFGAHYYMDGTVERLISRNNLLIAVIKNGELVSQEVIPYIYKEDKYVSVGSNETVVYFGDDQLLVVYPDYSVNYNAEGKFNPTTKEIPFANKPIHAFVRYDYSNSSVHHKVLEVRGTNGITYSQKASYLEFTHERLRDGSYFLGCNEWGVASLKHTYVGRLIVE